MYVPPGLGGPGADSMETEPDPFGEEDALMPSAGTPTPQQFLEQNQALLQAINLEREEQEAALRRNSESISLQLRLLQDNLGSQTREDLRELRRSSQFVLAVAAAIGGLTLVLVLVSAWLQVWTLKQITVKLSARPWGRGAVYGDFEIATGPPLRERLQPSQNQRRLSRALEQLDLRLTVLEQKMSPRPPAVEPQRQSPASTTARHGPVPAKSRMPAHVAITVGEGEAIRFLPRDKASAGLSWLQPLFKSLNRLFHPGRSNRTTPPVKVQLKK